MQNTRNALWCAGGRACRGDGEEDEGGGLSSPLANAHVLVHGKTTCTSEGLATTLSSLEHLHTLHRTPGQQQGSLAWLSLLTSLLLGESWSNFSGCSFVIFSSFSQLNFGGT